MVTVRRRDGGTARTGDIRGYGGLLTFSPLAGSECRCLQLRLRCDVFASPRGLPRRQDATTGPGRVPERRHGTLGRILQGRRHAGKAEF